MIIRKAVEADKVEFAFLAKKFLKESKYPFSLDMDKLLESFGAAINNQDFAVLVMEDDGDLVGMLVGGVAQPLFSLDRVATELAWFVLPEHRDSRHSIKLLKAYEDWAEEVNCKFVTMVDIHTLNDLTALYERKGYSLTEKTFVKEI